MNNYFIGIDIGTNSIGYAVTDTNYNLLKKSSKAMWGIRLLNDVNTCAERRTFRANRRRLQRRKERINLLQTLFAKEVAKLDETFFIRLKESSLYLEDKSLNNNEYTLFNDKNFTDKQYYHQFPTISHLKKYLIESEEKADIRLIYLAIHNIIKNRGHFLFENIGDRKPNFKDVFDKLNIYINNRFDFYISEDKIKEIENILKNTDLKPTNKEKELIKLFNLTKKNEDNEKIYLIVKAFSNNKFDLSKLFEDENLKDEKDKPKTLKVSEIDETILNTLPLSDEDKDILLLLKSIYDWSILENILKSNEFISFAKTEIYEKHKKDLKLLKEFLKENFSNEDYKKIFKDYKDAKGNSVNSYCNYIGLNKKDNKKTYVVKCNQDDFYKTLKNVFKNFKDNDNKDFKKINEDIEKKIFLPKQVTKDNSLIPYQLNLFELNKILDNACKHYPFFNEKDEDGITIKEKIVSIFKFKIPYYVGPLHKDSPFHWFEKNSGMEKQKILPWNFEKVINIEQSGEQFIKRMTNKCTYLHCEDVIAKNTLLYSEFMVLNELNNLRINSEKISVELKNKIFNDLFCKYKKVTKKRLKDYLITEGYIGKDDVISGIDVELKSSLASHIDFKDILTKYNNYDMVDEIINYIVIFGDDKNILKSKLTKLTKKYNITLTEKEINHCCSFKYSGWGRLSKKLLTGITDVNKDTGEVLNIINMMKNTNYNFMELLSKKFNFEQKINEENSIKKEPKSLLQTVNELYVSPKIKRPIYQSLLIIKELTKVQKQPPKKIFIEVAREKGTEKQRTNSRKTKLLALYESIKNNDEYKYLYESLQNTDSKEFDKYKIYLYYLQLGKCMYSAEPIPLEYLMDNNLYDRDHIYPQSKIKDDSFNNLVLVKRDLNAKKSNEYPLKEEVQNNQKVSKHWKLLKEKGFISEEKFKRLTRKDELTEEELNVFVERQLVETRQATKVVGNLLKQFYPDTEIVYVKANLVSEFRKKFDLMKCREVNDYHHAKDAYLNIVVGNVFNTEFNEKYFIKRLKSNEASLEKMFQYPVEGAWIVDNNKSITIVKNTMFKNNILFTRYSDTGRGGLFNQTIYPKGKNDDLLPLKNGLDTKKYGGYDSKSTAYFIVVESTLKNKIVRSINPIYMYNRNFYEENPIEYCKQVLKLENPKILVKKIKLNTLFSLDGLHLHLSGRSGNSIKFKLAMQLILNYKDEKYIRNIITCLKKENDNNNYFETNKNYIFETFEINRDNNITLYKKLIDKIKNSKYSIVLNNILKYMQEGKDKFETELTLSEQCKILIEIIKILHCNPSTGSFKILFNKYEDIGSIRISKNTLFKKINSLKIIYPSITGLYEQEVDLLGDDFTPKKRR